MKNKANAILSIFFGLLLYHTTTSAQQIQSMKLLTPQVGWAQSGDHLYWTADGGARWKDIAPPLSSKESLSGVFFLDTSTGWVVLSYPDEKAEQQFRVASTTNAGAAWSSSPIQLPWKRYAEDFFGGGGIFFLDQLHGWVDLGIYSSSSFKRGALLSTEDGGKTWKAPPGDSGMGGALCFFSDKDGVLAGGPDDTELWVTHDASKSWQEVSLKAPPEAALADLPTYGEPICADAKRGYLPVTFSRDGSPSTVVLFATEDGGRSWRVDRTQSGLEELSEGQMVAATVTGSDLVFAPRIMAGKVLELTTVPGTGRSNNVTTRVAGSAAVSQLSFVNSSTGWAATDDALLSTTDGGVTWMDITPSREPTRAPLPPTPQIKRVQPNSGLRFPVPPAANGGGRARADVASIEVHLGFDRGNAPALAQMQTWWNYSPYFDYQISLPGAANHPKNGNLTARWVTQVEDQGWGLWPVWVGPQATCMVAPAASTVFMTATNQGEAYTEGQTEAVNAIAAIQKLGGNLGNTIIYYDIENYDTTNSACVNIVEYFLNGWIYGLHSSVSGYYNAGVYGNVAPMAQNFSQLSPLPDDVWITLASGKTTPPSVTIWNLASSQVALCDTYSAPAAPPCPLWSNDQRIHQYIVDGANKIKYYETWGGVKLEIDPDIVDADVARPSTGTKLYTYNYDTFTPIGNWYNAAYSINNIGATANYGGFINGSASDAGGEVGQTLILDESLFPGDGVSGWGYSILDWGTSLDITPPAYIQSLGFCFGTGRVYYCTQMSGMNNAGWIAGYWNDWNSLNHGFLNQGGTLSSFDAPGAAGGIGTFATAINDAGLVVGYYYDPTTTHMASSTTPIRNSSSQRLSITLEARTPCSMA